MSSFVEPSRSRAVSRIAIMAALAAGVAGCSSDFSRFSENPYQRQQASQRGHRLGASAAAGRINRRRRSGSRRLRCRRPVAHSSRTTADRPTAARRVRSRPRRSRAMAAEPASAPISRPRGRTSPARCSQPRHLQCRNVEPRAAGHTARDAAGARTRCSERYAYDRAWRDDLFARPQVRPDPDGDREGEQRRP